MKRKLKAGESLRIFDSYKGLDPAELDALNRGEEVNLTDVKAAKIADKLTAAGKGGK